MPEICGFIAALNLNPPPDQQQRRRQRTPESNWALVGLHFKKVVIPARRSSHSVQETLNPARLLINERVIVGSAGLCPVGIGSLGREDWNSTCSWLGLPDRGISNGH